MWPPVTRVPDECELLALLEPAGQERAAADRRAGVRVVDPVEPHLRQVVSREDMLRQDDRVQLAPASERPAELDAERLRAEHPRASDVAVEHTLVERGLGEGAVLLVGELEVGGRDRAAVAPASLRPDAVGDRERLLRDGEPADEVRPLHEVRPGLEGALENLAQKGIDVEDRTGERIEARFDRLRRTRDVERAAARRRLLGRAAGRRHGGDRTDHDGCKSELGASHQRFPSSRATASRIPFDTDDTTGRLTAQLLARPARAR